MSKTTDQILQIISCGGGVSVDGESKTTDQLKQIAAYAKQIGVTIIIRNANSKTTDQLKQIAAFAPGKIIFEV